MPWSGEDDECGRGSDGPAGTDSSAVSPKGEQRPDGGGGREQQGALYASRSSAKAAKALALPGRRTKRGKK